MGEIFERVFPTESLEWTGERLTTATSGQIEIEHLHRYFLARDLCRGLDVLDVAAGEGYGTALIAQVAKSVVGVEISASAVAHAAAAYRGANFRFVQGDARRLPLDEASVDAVVSFETIEHFYEHDKFLEEVRRVLRPGGRFIVSSPDRDVYSPSGTSANPYHVRELSGSEFSGLLRKSFAQVRILSQRPLLGSALVSEGGGPGQTLTYERRGSGHFEGSIGLARPIYFVGIASDLPVADVPDSLYIETAEIGVLCEAVSTVDALRQELSLSVQQAHEQAASYREQLAVAAYASQAHADRAAALDVAISDVRAEAAATHDEARARLATAQAEAERQVASAQAEAKMQVASAQAKAEAHIVAAQAGIESARVETTSACRQRDIALIAARRAASASEGHWRERVLILEREIADLKTRSTTKTSRTVDSGRSSVRRLTSLIPSPIRRRLRAFLIKYR